MFAGCVPMFGATGVVDTDRVAVRLIAEPAELVTTAKYDPALNVVARATICVVFVAPAIGCPSLNHWYSGSGTPLAVTRNSALSPTATSRFPGCAPITGATAGGVTMSAAARLVAEPFAFLTITE